MAFYHTVFKKSVQHSPEWDWIVFLTVLPDIMKISEKQSWLSLIHTANIPKKDITYLFNLLRPLVLLA
jgi:hypothetical protein